MVRTSRLLMSLARWGKWSEKITEYRIHPEIKDFKRTSQHRHKESEDKIGQNERYEPI
jgi:hypothetical protein